MILFYFEFFTKVIITVFVLIYLYGILIENYKFENKRNIGLIHIPFYLYLNGFWVYMFILGHPYVPFYYYGTLYLIGMILTNYILTKYIKDW